MSETPQWWLAKYNLNFFFGPPGNPQFSSPIGGGERNAFTSGETESSFQHPVAASGELRKLRIQLDTAVASGKSWTFTLRKNGTNTALTCTVSAGQTLATGTGAVSVTAGDLLSVGIVPAGSPLPSSPGYVQHAIQFVPTTADQMVYGGIFCGVAIPGAAGRPYTNPLLHSNSGNTFSMGDVTNNRSVSAVDGYIRAIYVHTTVAPGGGGSTSFQMRINGSNVGSAVTFSGGTTDASSTGLSIAVAKGDVLSLQFQDTSSPAQGLYSFTVVLESSTTRQYMWCGDCVNQGTFTEYRTITSNSGGASARDTVEANTQMPMPDTLTITGLAVALATAPVAGTLGMRTRVNGANGNLDVGAISGTAASDYAHSDALSAGDLINLVATLPGGATTWSAHTWAVLLEAADPDATITAEVMTATARMIDAVFMGGIVPFLTDLEGDYVLVDELEGDWA